MTCEFAGTCPFPKKAMANMPADADDQIAEFCEKNNLRCARHMTYTALGAEAVPDDLLPGDKTRAYGIIAEG